LYVTKGRAARNALQSGSVRYGATQKLRLLLLLLLPAMHQTAKPA
jgi:hypothetical protein